MKELWIQATEIYNLPFTIGLILCCAYWLVSIIGIFDFDMDIEVEVGGGGGFTALLGFVNKSKVPTMLVLTILFTSMWTISLISNELWNSSDSLLVAIGLVVPNFIVSVIIVKYVTIPIAPLFKAINDDVEAAEPLVGQLGKVKSRVLDHNYGQVEVLRKNDSPALVNCKLRESDEPLVRGEEVLIISCLLYTSPSPRDS